MSIQDYLDLRKTVIDEELARDKKAREQAQRIVEESDRAIEYLERIIAMLQSDVRFRAFLISAGGFAVLRKPDFSNESDAVWLTIDLSGIPAYHNNSRTYHGAFREDYTHMGVGKRDFEKLLDHVRDLVRLKGFSADVMEETLEDWMAKVVEQTGNSHRLDLKFRTLYHQEAAEINPKDYGYLTRHD